MPPLRNNVGRLGIKASHGFASLMQYVAADSHRGKRIVFTGQLRARSATDSAHLIAAGLNTLVRRSATNTTPAN